jgi:hypothetical protein
MDLPYRFQLTPPVRREAADPTMAVYKNEYWLFPLKSGGYWHSPDGLHWCADFVSFGQDFSLHDPSNVVCVKVLCEVDVKDSI